MAIRSKHDSKKIILLLLLIFALLVGGVLLIDIVSRVVGVNIKIPFFSSIKERGLLRDVHASENPFLLEREMLEKKENRISLLEEIVLNREQEIISKEKDVNKKLESVSEREKELILRAEMLDDRDKQYHDRKKNIREQAEKLYQMPPQDAATILSQLSETDVVDILRAIDSYSVEIGSSSTAPYLIKLINDMDKVKAALIVTKLKYDSEDGYSGVEILDDPNIELPPMP